MATPTSARATAGLCSLTLVACIGQPWSEPKHPDREEARETVTLPEHDVLATPEPSPREAECRTYVLTFFGAMVLSEIQSLTRTFLPSEVRKQAANLAAAAHAPESDILEEVFNEQRALSKELAIVLNRLATAIEARNQRAYLQARAEAETALPRQLEVDRRASQLCGWPAADDPRAEAPYVRSRMVAKWIDRIQVLGDESRDVRGPLKPEEIQRTVRQNFERFRICYETGLTGNPKLQGKVSVRFVIGRDGGVTEAAVARRSNLSADDRAALDFLRKVNGLKGRWLGPGTTLPDDGVIECMIEAYKMIRFPAPKGGAVTVVYPTSFSPGS